MNTKNTISLIRAILIFTMTISSQNLIFAQDKLCESIFESSSKGKKIKYKKELSSLENIYKAFEDNVRAKNITKLNDITLHKDFPLYISGKVPTGIRRIQFKGPIFENYVTTTPGLELRISNTDFTILNGVATSWANFEEITSSKTSATGIDLFFYVKTENGWKLATTNNTFVIPGDDTDYKEAMPMPSSPKEMLYDFVEAFNTKDKEKLSTQFKTGATFIPLSSPELKRATESNSYSSDAFINCVVANAGNVKITIENDVVEIKDQYLAKIIADYTITIGNQKTKSGKLLFTAIGTPSIGWKISAGAMTY